MSKFTQRLIGFDRCMMSMERGHLVINFYEDDELIFSAVGDPALELDSTFASARRKIDVYTFSLISAAVAGMAQAELALKKAAK